METTAAHRRTLARRTTWLATLSLASALVGAGAASAEPVPSPLGATVTKTDTAPTGYEVTFRVESDSAHVYLLGDTYFTQPDMLGGAETFFSHEGRTGNEWREGDISHPLFTNVPAELTEVSEGLFEITMALPAGAFNYGFAHTDEPCTMGFSCTATPDPTNPPVFAEATGASSQALSQVFVPSHPSYPTYDADAQGHPVDGTLEHVLFTDAGEISPAGDNQLGVYLPPGYDPERAEPYQLLVLSHGAYDNETSWFSQGRAANIVEHAIDTGAIEDTVVVTTNFYNFDSGSTEEGTTLYAAYAEALRTVVLPLVEDAYHVSTERADRAFGGLSMGGGISTHLLQNDADLFGYFGIWSGAQLGLGDIAADELANLDSALGIHVGSGEQDYLAGIGEGSAQRALAYRQLGLRVDEHSMDGGHTFQVWRTMLHDYLENVAFADVPAHEPATLLTDISPVIDDARHTEFFTEISWLAEQGITRGWEADGGREFRPLGTITRDAMAAFLYRLAGSPEWEAPAVSPFIDVTPSTTEFYAEITWLADQQIALGWETAAGQEYRPLAPITRDAIAAFLYRFAAPAGYEAPAESAFVDVAPGSTEFFTEIAWLAESGISTGWVEGDAAEFRPRSATTRDAMAAFLFRLTGLAG